MTSIEKATDFEFESLKSSFMIKILNIFFFLFYDFRCPNQFVILEEHIAFK